MCSAAICPLCTFITDGWGRGCGGGGGRGAGWARSALQSSSGEIIRGGGPLLGGQDAALSIFPLAGILAFVGINDLVLFLQPMVYFYFFYFWFFFTRTCWQAWSHRIGKARGNRRASPSAGSELAPAPDENVKACHVWFLSFGKQAMKEMRGDCVWGR